MSLQNKLYTITGERLAESGERIYTLRFNASHPLFAGHFPGHPIVPGACLIQIAEELTVQTTSRPGAYTAIRNLKFRQPITPEMPVAVKIDGNKVEIGDAALNTIYASFTASYMCPDSDVQ